MSNFELSNTVDKDKVFFVNLSEIDERLDPLFYKAVENIKNNIENKAKFDYRKLVKACSIKRGRFGHRPRNDPRFYGGKYPFIQTGDIVKASETNNKIEYTQTLNELGLKTSKMFQPPQLLFTIAANIGDTAILDYPSCFPDSVVALIPNNKDELILEYFDIYLKLIKKYVVELAPYSAQRNLNNQQLAQVPVIIPPIDIQKSIIDKYGNAQQTKQQKEAEAEKLLNSIDEYLLGELGITLPEKDNSLPNRIFTTSLSKVSGGRFDPKLYDNNTQALRTAISKSKFKTSKLKDFITQSIAGDWGKDENEKLGDNYIRCLVIRATEFDNLYNLNLDNSRVKYRLIHKDKIEKIDIQENDLLIEKSGGSPDQPVGRISILTKDILDSNQICYSNFIHKIRVSEEINPEYLFCFLKSVHNIKLTDAMQSQTNGIRNLIMNNYFNQDIPLPEMPKQNEIVEHIKQIREQAKRLQNEAVAELEKSKQAVEQMILGS